MELDRTGNSPSGYIRLPDDLESVCRIGTSAEVTPSEAETSQKKIDAIWQGTHDLYRTRSYPGISMCVRRNGHLVLNRTIGHARGAGPSDSPQAIRELLEPDTPICIFSASKAITAVLMLKLVDNGEVSLNDPVARFIPEFGNNGKQRVTIGQVLSHRGGFPLFELKGEPFRLDMLLDWDHCIETICKAEPRYEPGRYTAYHTYTAGYILAEIMKRVSGQSFPDFHDSELRQPLQMKYFTYGMPDGLREKAAQNYIAGSKSGALTEKLFKNYVQTSMEDVVAFSRKTSFHDSPIPTVNLHCTAEELSRFFQMLLDNGMWNGRQVLKPETVDMLRKPAAPFMLDKTLKLPIRYSMGLMLGNNPTGLYGLMCGQAFGHIGMMNIFGWADPSRNMSAALITTGKAFLGRHILALRKWQAAVSRI